MNIYIKSIITTNIICGLVMFLSPRTESMKKYLKYICGLVTLLTLLLPLIGFIQNTEGLIGNVKSFFEHSIISNSEKDIKREDALVIGSIQETAYTIMTYISSTYRVPSQNISVCVITNDSNKKENVIVDIHIYLTNISPLVREQIQRELQNMMDVSVYVFGK